MGDRHYLRCPQCGEIGSALTALPLSEPIHCGRCSYQAATAAFVDWPKADQVGLELLRRVREISKNHGDPEAQHIEFDEAVWDALTKLLPGRVIADIELVRDEMIFWYA